VLITIALDFGEASTLQIKYTLAGMSDIDVCFVNGFYHFHSALIYLAKIASEHWLSYKEL